MNRAMMTSVCFVIACAAPTFAQDKAFFPLEVGNRWIYRVTDPKAPPGQADAKRKAVIEVERQEVYTEKKKDKGIETTKDYTGFILKMTSGGKSTLDHVVVLPNGLNRVHVAETPINPPMLFFKYGTNPGDSWTLDSVSGNKSLKGTFTIKADTVTVPYRKERLSTWMVSFHNNKQGDERSEVDTWFAPEIGIVKQRIKGQNQEVLMELEKFEKAK
jgi:hypothetical protein